MIIVNIFGNGQEPGLNSNLSLKVDMRSKALANVMIEISSAKSLFLFF